jgi:hypothetical protein
MIAPKLCRDMSHLRSKVIGYAIADFDFVFFYYSGTRSRAIEAEM